MAEEEINKTNCVNESTTTVTTNNNSSSESINDITNESSSSEKPKKTQKVKKNKKTQPKNNKNKVPVLEHKLKILCLHGYAQNLVTFKKRTAVLKKAMKNVADLEYVGGPHYINIDPGTHEKVDLDFFTEEEKPLSWWNFSEDEKIYYGLEESIDYLIKIMKEKGPFDGILAFSQGSSMAATLCAYIEREKEKNNPDLPEMPKFIMLFSGFRPDGEVYDKYFDLNKKLKVPSLQVYGENDTWLNPERSKKLITYFENPTILTHSGGHFIPTEAEKRHYYVDYVLKFAPKE